jgi:hypothetical protein
MAGHLDVFLFNIATTAALSDLTMMRLPFKDSPQTAMATTAGKKSTHAIEYFAALHLSGHLP